MKTKFEVPAEKLVPTSLLKDDLKLDSLDFVDMFVMLEEEMNHPPQNVDFMSIRTLGDIYQLVSNISLQKPVQ